MDCRVKPGNDDIAAVAAISFTSPPKEGPELQRNSSIKHA